MDQESYQRCIQPKRRDLKGETLHFGDEIVSTPTSLENYKIISYKKVKGINKLKNKEIDGSLNNLLLNTQRAKEQPLSQEPRKDQPKAGIIIKMQSLDQPNNQLEVEINSKLGKVIKDTMENYFDKPKLKSKLANRQASFMGSLKSLNSLKNGVSFKSLERVRNLSFDKMPTSFETATMQFIRNDNLMHVKKPLKHQLKQFEKIDLSNTDRKISKGEKYNMINKELDKDLSNVISDKSFQQIMKYSELLLINDDEFIAARRQLFNKHEGNVNTQS